jgi:hypothetical protein
MGEEGKGEREREGEGGGGGEILKVRTQAEEKRSHVAGLTFTKKSEKQNN